MFPRHTLVSRLCLLVTLATLGFFVAHALRHLRDSEGGIPGDLSAFFTASRAMLEGGNIYAPSKSDYIYPPLIAFLYAPIVRLGDIPAEIILLFINAAAMLGALWISARESLRKLGDPLAAANSWLVVLLAIIVIGDKLRSELRMWQTNTLLVLLLALALRWLDRRPILAGLALGMAVNVKYLPIVFLPYLLLRRRWTAAGAFVGGIILFGLLPATLTGWDRNLQYLGVTLKGLINLFGIDTGETVHNVNTANIQGITAQFSLSITSALARLFEMIVGAGASPDAIESAHRWAFIAAIFIGIIAGFACVLAYVKRKIPLLVWPAAELQTQSPVFTGAITLDYAAILGATLCLSPQTNPRHLTMLILIVAPACALMLVPRRAGEPNRLPLAVALGILTLAIILPPGGTDALDRLVCAWRLSGGISWCLLAFIPVLMFSGLGYLKGSSPIQSSTP